MALLFKNLLFTVLVPGTVAVYLPLLIAAGRRPAPGGWRLAGFALLAAGAAVYAWCVWDFATRGRGTPAPIDAPRHLVVRGLYRHVRNPMYLGVLAAIFGWAVSFRDTDLALYALAVAIGFHVMVMLYEEPHLEQIFGQEYEDYCARTPRWVPRLHAPHEA